MVCSLEFILPIIVCITAVAGATTAISESLPFLKRFSGNGIIHSIYHMIKPEKCIDKISSSDSLSSLEEDI